MGGIIQFENWFPIEHAILCGQSLEGWKKSFPASANAPGATLRYVRKVFRDKTLLTVLVPHYWQAIAVKTKS